MLRFIIFVLIIIGIIKFIQAMRKPVEQRKPAEPIDYRTWKFTPHEKYYTSKQLEIGSERMAKEYADYVENDINDPDYLGTPEFESEFDNPFHYHIVFQGWGKHSRDDQRELEAMYLHRIDEFCGDVEDEDPRHYVDPDDIRLQLKEDLIRRWLQYTKRPGIDTTAVHIGYDDAGEPQLMDTQNSPIYPEKLMRFLIDNE